MHVTDEELTSRRAILIGPGKVKLFGSTSKTPTIRQVGIAKAFRAAQRFASSQTFEYLSAMANEIAIVDGEDLRKRAGALRRFL